MDFIERITGLSPDQGSGGLEAGILLATIVIVAIIFVARKKSKNSR